MKSLIRNACTLLVGCAGIASAAQPEEELADRFSQRWFDIEIIVFERLPVLDATTTERLTHTRPRRWPRGLLEMGPASQPTSAQFAEANQYCFASVEDESQLARQLGLQNNEFSDVTSPVLADPQREDERVSQQDEEREPTLQDIVPPDDVMPPPPPDPQELFDALVADYEQQLLNESYQWRDDLMMSNDVKSINRQRDLRPVLHLRWRQPVPERSQPAPIWVRAPVTPDAPATSAGLPKIEGYIAVTVGRFLHFAPTLWYNADTVGMTPVPFPAPTYLQPIKKPTGYMELAESRRMRSEELHYLDHPKFGVIVRIDPIPVPEHIQTAWDDLHTDEPASATIRAAETPN